MKQLLYPIILLFIACTGFTQAETEAQKEETTTPFSEVMPEYPGGMNKLRRHVQKNFKEPSDFTGKGRVIVRFTVMEDGSVGNVVVMKPLDDCQVCNENAIEAVKQLPEKFSPGLSEGKPVKVNFSMPIIIDASSKAKKKKEKKKRK